MSRYAQGKVAGPAMALIVVSAISLVLLVLALLFDVWFLLSGHAAAAAARRGTSEESAVVVRIVWSLAMLANNVGILFGAVQMRGLQSLAFSRIACVLALIPCLGPCFIIGVPFGIWGLIALSDPKVKRGFDG